MVHTHRELLCRDFTLSTGDETVPTARRLILSTVGDWGLPLPDETLDDLALLSGEVIANALQHATGPYSVVVSWTRARLRVEVADTARPLRTSHGGEPYAESGRGLLLVAALAADWGSTPTATGKTVWFEVAPHAPTSHLDRPAS
ncbi:ATP-binding protein [Streptomyces sp. D2-8]|uniref:ATP-binding protein n=1 Tax=Streptomyces sp. D2-8 TaxID=2707767 RepID=UPI0020BE5587|nr:ATP-binding protein [Streptomyces sp. D2-8]MCK8437459.1 ATP-binding protein [Streptomyces sp. D2-8]